MAEPFQNTIFRRLVEISGDLSGCHIFDCIRLTDEVLMQSPHLVLAKISKYEHVNLNKHGHVDKCQTRDCGVNSLHCYAVFWINPTTLSPVTKGTKNIWWGHVPNFRNEMCIYICRWIMDAGVEPKCSKRRGLFWKDVYQSLFYHLVQQINFAKLWGCGCLLYL